MSEMHTDRTWTHRFGRGALSGLIGFGVSGAAWWSLLGWDHTGTYDTDGNYSGPYESWQVTALVVVLGVLAGWLGVRGSFFAGPSATAVALTASFAVDAHSDSSGLWVVGATMLAVGCFVGMSFGALVVHLLAAVRHRVRPALVPR
jgi:hypothetical protein